MESRTHIPIRTVRGWGNRGFTLMEIMLVVIIIGILAALVATNFTGMSEDARVARAKSDIQQLRMQLGLFEQRYGHYPNMAENGLRALLERPSTIPEKDWRRFGDSEPTDPWGNMYIYLVGSSRVDPDRDYNLYSMGPNGQDDGMKEDDIH